VRAATAATASALVLAGASAAEPPVRAAPTTVTVFAAASLSEPFTELATLLRQRHPGLELRFNFAGSQQLVAQLEQGARADLFASADERWMQEAASKGLVAGVPATFAHNRLVIIVPATNPARIDRPFDLARGGVKLVIAADAVPAGRYARLALAGLGRQPGAPPGFGGRALANVVSQEDNVKSIVGKVRLGEADAGIVYRSDVTRGVARWVRAIEIPAAANVTATYPVATLRDAPHPEAASAVVDLLLSPEGQALLRRHGFDPAAPPPAP
jgi:molybdate transport system substrate-binding protein